MTRETKTSGKIIHELRYVHKLFVVNNHGNQFQSGLPDMTIIKDGVHYWVECKMEDDELRNNQSSVRKQLEKQNVHVYVLRFIDAHYWLVDEFYQIRFRVFKDGVKQLLEILTEVEKSRLEKGTVTCNVSQMDSTTT